MGAAMNEHHEAAGRSTISLVLLGCLAFLLPLTTTGCPDTSLVEAAAVAADKASLQITFASEDSAASVTQNLTLPTAGPNGTAISWASNNTAVVSTTGVVTRPATTTDVTLTATISKGSASDTKQFPLTVLQITDAQAVAADKASLQITFASGDSASSVTQNLTLPTAGPNGTAISWASSNTGIVSTTGVVTRPATTTDVTLTATISKGSASDTKPFPVSVIQCPGSLDTTFDPGSGANDWINPLAIQADGRILIGGNFTSYNGTTRNSIARLNSSGSLDATFDPGTGANNYLSCITLQGDGKIVIGGGFTTFNGAVRNHIARLNFDGSLDTTFIAGGDGGIRAAAVQPNGKIIIAGDFTSFSGIERWFIARLNSNSYLDTGFDPGSGANYPVWALALQPDGNILIGGEFTTYNSTSRNHIARLSSTGSLDTTFDPGLGANGSVWALVLQGDGKIIIGGGFTSYNGVTRNGIARLNANGSLDTTFDPGSGANDSVTAAAVQGDGRIIIGGMFTSYNGVVRNRIARLNANGSLDTTFDPGSGPSERVLSIAIQGDRKILIVGLFAFYSGSVRNRIARIWPD